MFVPWGERRGAMAYRVRTRTRTRTRAWGGCVCVVTGPGRAFASGRCYLTSLARMHARTHANRRHLGVGRSEASNGQPDGDASSRPTCRAYRTFIGRKSHRRPHWRRSSSGGRRSAMKPARGRGGRKARADITWQDQDCSTCCSTWLMVRP